MTSDQSVGIRAGFWRRFFALFIDLLVVVLPFQVLVAVLFTATSGHIQMTGGITHQTCTRLQSVEQFGALIPPPPAGANAAQDCSRYFFGAQTARYLVIARITREGMMGTIVSRAYFLDPDGDLVAPLSVDWIAALALIAYLLLMETESGATLGNRVTGARVVDVLEPETHGLPLGKVLVRYLVMFLAAAPLLAVYLVYAARYGMDIVEMAKGDFFNWLRAAAALTFAWMVYIVVQIAMKRDPFYDRVAGTAVVLVMPGKDSTAIASASADELHAPGPPPEDSPVTPP